LIHDAGGLCILNHEDLKDRKEKNVDGLTGRSRASSMESSAGSGKNDNHEAYK
jgi:hypothetical protein